MKDKRTYQDRKEYLRKYNKNYYHKNPKQKERCLKRNKTKEFKEYQKGWVNNNKERNY